MGNLWFSSGRNRPADDGVVGILSAVIETKRSGGLHATDGIVRIASSLSVIKHVVAATVFEHLAAFIDYVPFPALAVLDLEVP